MHPLVYTWSRYLSQFFIIFFYLIRQYIINEKGFIPNSLKHYSKVKLIIIIFGLFLLDLCSMLCLIVSSSTQMLVYNEALRAFFFFFTLWLCKLLLSVKYYKHHYLGITIYSIQFLLVSLQILFTQTIIAIMVYIYSF